jgi:hypothetical protein
VLNLAADIALVGHGNHEIGALDKDSAHRLDMGPDGERFAATGENPINYIVRHMNLDPETLGADDQLQNLLTVREGMRVFSAYEPRDGTRIWIIIEADRSVTTILLPEE